MAQADDLVQQRGILYKEVGLEGGLYAGTMRLQRNVAWQA